MSYQPLARKYRPSQFHQLVGQEAVSTALANAIAMGREPHGVIFTGVRGVGKTTVARLYAKALNCEAPTTSPGHPVEPCDRCESCIAIMRGNHEDVLEIDGASNTGVGDVRALQETIDYRPQRSRFKVYIIDEVHMLSQAAFNALLKTLEEPPSHVVFVFATTEMAKVPQTILSRCQAFYLRKLAVPLILDRLKAVLQHEHIESEDKALAAIAREGRGSMRDALTLLDQAIALGLGKVTVLALGPLVSTLSTSPYLELLGALVARDGQRVLNAVAALDQSGAELVDVVETAAQLARHAFVVQGLGTQALDAGLLGLDDGELAALKALADAAPLLDLNRIFRSLVACRAELDGSSLDRFVVENYLLEWCFDPGFPSIETLLESQPAPKAAARGPVSLSGALQPPVRGASAPTNASGTARPVASAPGNTAPSAPAPTSISAPPSHGVAPVSAPSHGVAAVSAPAHVASAPVPSAAQQPVSQAAPQQAAANLVQLAPAAPSGPEAGLPPTWRQLVDRWKQQKPLQARKLEEAHPIEYSAARIVLAVSETSYAGKGLLQREEQARIREQFRELFGFQGTLLVTAREGGEAPEAALPETVLSERGREQATQRERLVESVTNAPLTRDLVKALGGTVEGVRLPGGD